MLSSTSRLALRRVVTRHGSRSLVSTAGAAGGTQHRRAVAAMGAMASVVVVAAAAALSDDGQHGSSFTNNKVAHMAARVPTSGDVLSVGKITKEPATGLAFPALCNGMSLAGVGVRIKYVFVKVYAVGTYLDPVAMAAVKKGGPAEMEAALLDPMYPRTIRIVMNRGLSVDKFIAAIVEAVEPRLKGQNLETLDEFKKLFPPVDLVEGAEVEMTIRGDMLLLKNATGGVGTIKSQAFTEAMCDVYYGPDAVSPTMKENVLKGIPNL